jgi:hypothetical protein
VGSIRGGWNLELDIDTDCVIKRNRAFLVTIRNGVYEGRIRVARHVRDPVQKWLLAFVQSVGVYKPGIHFGGYPHDIFYNSNKLEYNKQ